MKISKTTAVIVTGVHVELSADEFKAFKYWFANRHALDLAAAWTEGERIAQLIATWNLEGSLE